MPVAKRFIEQGFVVQRVYRARNARALVEVSAVPANHILKNFHRITEVNNGERRELTVGYWLGCHVALTQ